MTLQRPGLPRSPFRHRRSAQPPPNWYGPGEPWRAIGEVRPHPRRSVRRRAGPAFVALLVASGIGFAWSGDLGIVTTSRTGAAADAPAGPVASSVPSPATTADSAATTAPAAASPAAPSAADPSAASDAIPDASFATSSAPPVPLTSIAPLADNPVRRRAQTWEPPEPPSALEGYIWPLPHGRITDPFGPSPFGSRVVDGQLFHDGLDIATFCRDRIVAAHAGIVLAAGRRFDEMIGWVGDLGPYFARLDEKKTWWTLPITVVIDDGNGYRSIYAHFYQVDVKPGQRVQAGQFLGYEGATGRATGCHLHYGLFAPHETATFEIEPGVVRRMLVPPGQIARIDPLLVLPRRAGDEAPTPVDVPGSGHGIRD